MLPASRFSPRTTFRTRHAGGSLLFGTRSAPAPRTAFGGWVAPTTTPRTPTRTGARRTSR